MPPAHTSLPAPSPDAAAHSERLAALIRAEIAAAGGWIGFDRYMELALYAPGLGYYAAGARKFGQAAAGGDFVTAPEISPLFAQALATQLAPVMAATAPRIIEFGAGSGALARDLLAAFDARGIAVDRYDIVELSADLHARQRARLPDPRVRWLEAPPRQVAGVIIAQWTPDWSAIDGYSAFFEYDEVEGNIPTSEYDTTTGNLKEVPHENLGLILMYEQNGKPLSDDDGKPLRLAVAGDDRLLTEGFRWVRWVERIEVIHNG